MATANSTKGKRPAKPYDGFPLGWHPAGYWCKRIRGKLHYFGSRWCDWQEALNEYQELRDDLHAGRTPRHNVDGVTVKYLCNHFLTEKKSFVASGELTQRSLDDYKRAVELLVKYVDRHRLVEELTSGDFRYLRGKLAEGRAPTTLEVMVTRIKVIFHHAYESELIDRPISVKGLKAPSRKVLKAYRNKQDKRLFTPEQIHDLIDSADDQLRAMILLGINAGLGNTDCSKLEKRHIDFAGGWLDFPRPKTGEDRRAKLWSETVLAIERVLVEDDCALIFRSPRAKGAWRSESISRATRQLLNDLKIYRAGLSHYTLRHTFRTIADGTKDQPACNLAMGHVDSSMAGNYRQEISDERLQAVADHVHAWLFGELE